MPESAARGHQRRRSGELRNIFDLGQKSPVEREGGREEWREGGGEGVAGQLVAIAWTILGPTESNCPQPTMPRTPGRPIQS